MKKLLLVAILFGLTTTYLNAQAPGGVTVDLKYWLKADAGTNTTTNNAQVSSWANQASGFSNSLTQGTTNDRPIYKTNGLNFNPSIDFDGATDYLTNTSETTGGWFSHTQIIVFNPTAVVSPAIGLQIPFAYDILPGASAADAGIGFGNNPQLPCADSYFFNSGDNDTTSPEYIACIDDANFSSPDPFLAIVRQNAASASGTPDTSPSTFSEHRLWGADKPNNRQNPTQYGVHSNRPFSVGRRHNGSFNYQGNVVEVISFSSRLTGTDLNKVESYLAIKYGITLDQTTPQDYISSNGTSIYDADGVFNNYDFNIAGIGRDDASGLNQKQSKSTTTNSVSTNNPGLITIGNGAVAATNASNGNNFSANLSFLLWGNNGASSSIATDVNTANGMLNRMDRVWAVQETGTVGTVQIQIPQALFGGQDQVILVSNNDTFGPEDTVIPLSVSGSNYTVSINLANGQFFTFAETPQPVSCSTTIPSNNVPGYTESFEGDIGDWVQAGGDDGNWLLLNQATPSAGTGPSTANDGNFFAYIEASTTVANGGPTPGAIGQNARAILESPCFDLSETADVFFTFDYHTFGAAIGNIALDISVTEGVWTNLFTTPNMSVNDWQTFAADLSGYNQSVKLRLVGTTGATFSSDLAIDNVRFTSPSGCAIATTYDGSPGDGWTNGIPTINTVATITSNYNTTTVGTNIDACSLLITNNAALTITANDYANVNGDITIDPGASLIIEHQGSLVQIDDDAQVINNGTTNVIVTTPVLQTRDFTVMGSPMNAETRDGVFAIPFLVLDFNPSDFIPHPDVPAGGTNWADEDGNFHNEINGATPINPGEGYVVRPQDSYTDPANEAYTFTFSNGTLNNGIIDYTATNNGGSANPNGTPNAVSNPYPSAISASAFMTRNGINELYFWEHLTPPGTGLPGSNLRFDMDDISIRNMVMGMPAANDTGTSTAPNNVIATAQGFGIRTNGAANTTQNIEFNNSMRLTTGNTTLRKPNNNTESLIIEVREDQYNAGGFMGIAFTPNATSELDEGYDTNRLATIVSLYSHLADGTEELGIQSREPFSSEIEIPLGFSTQVEGKLNYTIALSSVTGSILETTEISLVDLKENTTTLLSENSYTFTSDKGRNDNRFLLKFENSVLSNETPTLVDSINIYPNPTEGSITINTQNDVLKAITVTDIHGRTILQENTIDSNITTIDISAFKSAIYFLNITTKKGSATKKIVKK